MANFKVQGRNRHVQGASNIKYTASVSANGLQNCWCEGFRVPCRRVRVVSTRRYHAKQVKTRGNVINYFIEASAIKYWLLGIAGNLPQRLEEPLANQEHNQEQSEESLGYKLTKLGLTTGGGFRHGQLDMSNPVDLICTTPIYTMRTWILSNINCQNTRIYICALPAQVCPVLSFSPHLRTPIHNSLF